MRPSDPRARPRARGAETSRDRGGGRRVNFHGLEMPTERRQSPRDRQTALRPETERQRETRRPNGSGAGTPQSHFETTANIQPRERSKPHGSRGEREQGAPETAASPKSDAQTSREAHNEDTTVVTPSSRREGNAVRQIGRVARRGAGRFLPRSATTPRGRSPASRRVEARGSHPPFAAPPAHLPPSPLPVRAPRRTTSVPGASRRPRRSHTHRRSPG